MRERKRTGKRKKNEEGITFSLSRRKMCEKMERLEGLLGESVASEEADLD